MNFCKTTRLGVTFVEISLAIVIFVMILVITFNLFLIFRQDESERTAQTGCSSLIALVEEQLRHDMASVSNMGCEKDSSLSLYGVLQEDGRNLENVEYEFSDDKREIVRRAGSAEKKWSFSQLTQGYSIFQFTLNFFDSSGKEQVAADKASFVEVTLVIIAANTGKTENFSFRVTRKSRLSEAVGEALIWKD
ncbi:MAG: hypothetical protein KKB51_14325 [Candidatus Riflebacteria bacterium]|nr:hypothetical protein [Candidatus Riflebacteria bacterium]